MVANKNSSESNIFEELFRFWGGEMCFSLERCCNLKKTCLKRETETRFFDKRLKRERCRKNKKAVKSLQCERLNRGEGSVAAVSCTFLGPTFDLNYHFFEREQDFWRKNMKTSILSETKHHLLEKGAVAATALSVFYVCNPSSVLAPSLVLKDLNWQYFARRPKLHLLILKQLEKKPSPFSSFSKIQVRL